MKIISLPKQVPGTFFLLLFSFLFFSFSAQPQNKVYVDSTGILRWTADNEEASFFGVNYAAPFAHAYRSLKKLNIPVKEVIDTDVEHLARLEFDAYRIHVWDREVSDKQGNLLENEHIELLDYLIHKLKQKGFYIILTPIAWWGTGWPEPDPETPGFSNSYNKVQMITEQPAREAQKNYLSQFVNHKNKYDNVSYKDDPSIIAFEIINEPHHPSDTALTSSYIKEMAQVLRNEGISKPIYYNISENWPVQYKGNEGQVSVVYNSDIDGISFQWYPTGLVKRSELEGNYLSHVDHYPLPDITDKKFTSKTKMVYEFDAADKAGSYMYPAMARSFKEAGMQWATMFCYDPSALAAFNTEYQTHYLNLLYTPQKAISMLIASKIFKDVKAYTKFNSNENLEFDDYKISYSENLSQLNSDTKFYYSNNTSSVPKNISALQHIAGYGSSPLVKTDSRGSYFLDKLADGSWRMEIFPDAVWLTDPFGANSLDRKVASLFYNESSFELHLPGLDSIFYAYIADELNISQLTSQGYNIRLKPGVYIISKEKLSSEFLKQHTAQPLKIQTDSNTYVIHQPLSQAQEGAVITLQAEVYSESPVTDVQLYIRAKGWQRFSQVAFKKKDKHSYTAELPAQLSRNGLLEYCIVVHSNNDTLTFPGGVKGSPGNWDYKSSGLWELNIVPAGNPIVLFDPEKDFENLIFPNVWDRAEYSTGIVYSSENESLLELRFNKFKKPLEDFTFQVELDYLLKNELKAAQAYNNFRLYIYLDEEKIDSIYFRYITNDAFAKAICLTGNKQGLITSPVNSFTDDSFVLLPRPYPRFLPYYFKGEKVGTKMVTNDISEMNFLQFSIPASGLNESGNGARIRIGKIELVQ